MTVVRWTIRQVLRLWMLIRRFYAWLKSVVLRIVRPPAEAIMRVLRAIVQATWRFVEALLAAWARIWSRNPETRRFAKPRHVQACFALATLTMAAVCYVTPAAKWIGFDGTLVFVAFAWVTWLIAFLLFVRWSTSDSERWWVQSLARMRARTGLVTVERLGTLAAALALLVVPVAAADVSGFVRSWPLRLLALITFVVFLADTYNARSASRSGRFTPGLAQPDSDTTGHQTEIYEWKLEIGELHHDCHIEIPINLDRYEEARERNPRYRIEGGEPRFEEWVVRGVTPEVDGIAAEFESWCATNRWSPLIEICLVVSFAQHFQYRTDEESTGFEEYWRYPLETLHDREGDCDDMSILAAAILRRMGHTVAIFVTQDHAALAVSAPPGVVTDRYVEVDGQRFYYCETTAEGWRVGEIPDEIDPGTLRLRLVEPVSDDLAEAV